MANKITEQTKTVQLVKADAYSAATTYNGAADASGLGVDVSGYNEALIILNSGTATGTNTVTLVSSNDNSTAPSTWDAISSAAFTAVTSANDDAVQVARLHVGGDKKYLAVKSVVATNPCDFGVVAVLTGAQSEPTDDYSNAVFDV
jgi:hypothetical protein